MIELSRRTFLSAAATSAVGRDRRADYDCVIIGAGAAGLAAGQELARRGARTVILEARGRIGGRTLTDTISGIPFDAGASFIHWPSTNPWTAIASRNGFATRLENHAVPRLYRDGTRLPPEQEKRQNRAYDQASARLDGSGPNETFASFAARATPELADAVRSVALFDMGEDPDRVPTAFYKSLAGEASDRLVPRGYGALVAHDGRRLAVTLSTPALSVDWSGSGVAVETPRGRVDARTCIVTASVGVLKSGSIAFVPSLPAPTASALEHLSMSALAKVVLRFDGARFDLPAETELVATNAAGWWSFEMWPFGRDIVVGYVGGDHSRTLAAAGEPAAVDEALTRLTEVLGSGIRGHCREGRLASWTNDPLSLGSYSMDRLDTGIARRTLARPVAGRLWFAGEATAGPHAVTVGGATLEGRRAARAVLRAR